MNAAVHSQGLREKEKGSWTGGGSVWGEGGEGFGGLDLVRIDAFCKAAAAAESCGRDASELSCSATAELRTKTDDTKRRVVGCGLMGNNEKGFKSKFEEELRCFMLQTNVTFDAGTNGMGNNGAKRVAFVHRLKKTQSKQKTVTQTQSKPGISLNFNQTPIKFPAKLRKTLPPLQRARQASRITFSLGCTCGITPRSPHPMKRTRKRQKQP